MKLVSQEVTNRYTKGMYMCTCTCTCTHIRCGGIVLIIFYVYRINGRVRKRAMTKFERDRTMSNLLTQLDYQVHVHVPKN